MEKLEHTVFQISELIGKERFGTLSEEENEVLEEWRRQSAEHETLYQKLQDTRYLSESVARLSGIDTRQPLLHMQTNCRLYPSQANPSSADWVEWQLYSLFCWGASGWFTGSLRFGNLRSTGPFWQEGLVLFYIWETAKLIHLETLQQTITQGEVRISKTDDRKLSYDSRQEKNEKSGKVVYNEIEIPRGGEIRFGFGRRDPGAGRMAEGRLRYPVEFSGKREKSRIGRGKAHFQVEKNPSLPFRVEGRNQVIEGLGTEFNVSGYKDEANASLRH